MIELLSLIGGGIGGVLRLVPEFLKYLSAGKDREHEYRMTQLQLEIDRARAAMAIDLVHAQGDAAAGVAQMRAYAEALRGQEQLTGIYWVDAINKTVRPFVTYWWMFLLTLHKACAMIAAWGESSDLTAFASQIWSANDWGILSMILGFWFVDRAIKWQK